MPFSAIHAIMSNDEALAASDSVYLHAYSVGTEFFPDFFAAPAPARAASIAADIAGFST